MTEEQIAELKAANDAATASIKALEATNKQLKAEKVEAKRLADEAEAAREEAANEAASKAGDVETVKAALERKHATALTKLTNDLAARDTRLGELLIDNAIKDAITSNNVLPQFAKAVEAMLRAGAKIENGEAVKDGMPLADATGAFFTSADAKHFVSAPANSGAGATGAQGKGTPLQKAPETAEEWADYMKLANDNPAEAQAFATKHGIA